MDGWLVCGVVGFMGWLRGFFSILRVAGFGLTLRYSELLGAKGGLAEFLVCFSSAGHLGLSDIRLLKEGTDRVCTGIAGDGGDQNCRPYACNRDTELRCLLRMASSLTIRDRSPSFKGLTPSSADASKAKKANRCRDTAPELLLRRELWRRGMRYRVHSRRLPGNPDIVFPRQKLAVFCDGDFWHGRNWPSLQGKLRAGTNGAYWVAKIARNRRRDRETGRRLAALGWRIARLWEGEVRHDPAAAAELVKRLVAASPSDE